MKLRVLALSILVISPIKAMDSFALQGTSYLSPRSQSVNAARELVGWYRFINLPNECWYGAISATPSGGTSFRPERIAQYFFGTDELIIAGSQVANRQPQQILADYFGLSPLFQSMVSIKPKISTFLIDFDAYLGYKSWYVRAHAPVVWTKYAMNLHETIINSGSSTPYPALYMADAAINAPAASWSQAMAGGITYGEITQGINFGRITCGATTSGLSEIQVAIGYNLVSRPHGHAGFNLRGSIPTGTRPNAELLFQPIVGNGHHGEFGIGFTGHYLLWEKDGCQQAAIYSDVNATHLFNSRQHRSFDLCLNGFGSRYELVKLFNTSGNYIGQTVPLINITTLPCKVSAALQLDAVVMFSYIHKQWSFDLGYNAWLRTKQHITLCDSIALNEYGLKGIQNTDTLIGFSNATQSTATLFGSPFSEQSIVADPFPPVFISPANINTSSGAGQQGFTNKIFWHLSYVFDCHCYRKYGEPFLGFGGEAEFEGNNPRMGIEPNNNSISQWAVWIKGGLGF